MLEEGAIRKIINKGKRAMDERVASMGRTCMEKIERVRACIKEESESYMKEGVKD